MYIKARKYIYNRHESGTEVYETRWTTETVAQEGKEGLHLECKMDCDVLRMKERDDTYLAVASIGLLTGRSPVEVYTALRARGGSTVGTGSGLWGRQGQLLGYRNDQRLRKSHKFGRALTNGSEDV
jgi:hypothetical protein